MKIFPILLSLRGDGCVGGTRRRESPPWIPELACQNYSNPKFGVRGATCGATPFFRSLMTRNGSKKHALEKNSDIFRESAFPEDGTRVFHPLAKRAAVLRRCFQAGITERNDETRDSTNVLTEVQRVRKSQFGVDISWMVLRVALMYPY